MSGFFGDMAERKRAFWIFIPLLFLYASSYFQRTAIPGTLYDQLAADLGFTAEQIAGIGASFVFVYSFSQLVVGMFTDKYCGVRVVIAGGLFFAVGTLLMPLCDNLFAIYGCRMLTGLGAGTMYLSLVKETDRLFGRKNFSVMIGIVYFVGYSGGMFGTLPLERLCTVFPWRNILWDAGIVSCVLYGVFFLAKRALPLPPVAKTAISLRPTFRIMRNRFTWILFYSSSVNFGSYFIIQTVFGKKFLQDCAHLSSAASAGTLFALTIVGMTTMLASGILLRLIGNRRRPLIIFASAVNLLDTLMMIAALAYGLPGWIFILGYQLYAFASGFAIASTLTVQELNARDVLTQTTGFLNMGNYLFVAVCSVCVGKLLDMFVQTAPGAVAVYPVRAYLTVFLFLLGLSGLGSVLTFFMPETRGHYLHLKIDPAVRTAPVHA